jgi:hypothetical protein
MTKTAPGVAPSLPFVARRFVAAICREAATVPPCT